MAVLWYFLGLLGSDLVGLAMHYDMHSGGTEHSPEFLIGLVLIMIGLAGSIHVAME